MAKKKPTTKKGKERKISKVMREQKAGTLRTSAGKKPGRKQAIAIALSEAGVSKKPKKSKRRT